MLPLLRTLGLRAFSMASETYVSGTHSAAFVTCPNDTVARDLARGIVEKKLAACVNIVPAIKSVYEWQGKIEEDSEVLLMIKTRSSKVPALAEYVRFDVPVVNSQLPVVSPAPTTRMRWPRSSACPSSRATRPTSDG
ncbi:protein CutA homolog isoform X3 [Betta splendens]|nr:protein CutA homolog isoform X3 [Betta splendens]